MKNAVKKSFLAIPSQKLHTGPLCAGDQRRAHLVSIRSSKSCAKQLCSRTLFFLSKLSAFVRKWNQWEKITFLKKEKIELEKLFNYSWFTDLRNSWVAPVERELIFAYVRYLPKKIFWEEPFRISRKRPKMYIFVHAGIKRILPPRESMG